MRKLISRRRIGTVVLLGVCSTLLGLAAVSGVSGQEAVKVKSKGLKLRSVAREGYTRPGYPSDIVTESGEIKPAIAAGQFQGFGGTVYFVVLRLTGDEGDVWATGINNFDGSFRPGDDVNNMVSPALDTRAKYLYLYQLVNDRGVEQVAGGIKPADIKESIKAGPLYTCMIPLLVDPRYISSWGHFAEEGFNLDVLEPKGGEVPAGGKAVMEEKILAVSAAPAVIDRLPHKEYLWNSPAYSLSNWLGVGAATKGLAESVTIQKIKGVAGAGNWAKGLMHASKGAHEPDHTRLEFVDLQYQFGEEANLLTQFEAGRKYLVFRADWLKNNVIPVGQHSVLFGFTTDLPPVNVTSIVGGIALDKKAVGAGIAAAANILPAQMAGALAPAPGTLPTPVPPGPVAATTTAGFGGGSMGGFIGGGGGGGFGGGFGLPGVGGVLGGTTGGGGSGTTGGNGNNGQQQAAQQQQQQQGNNNNTPGTINITNNNNNNNSNSNSNNNTNNNSNQQSQNQNQNQQQNQQQNQNQNQNQHQNQNQRQHQHGQNRHNNHHHGKVVPAPAAVFLGLLGLPALYLAYRRRRGTTV